MSAAILLCVVSCSSPSGRRAREVNAATTSYSTDHVKCVNIAVTGLGGNDMDSVVTCETSYFVKNSSKIHDYINSTSDAMYKYNNAVRSIRVDTIEIEVNR